MIVGCERLGSKDRLSEAFDRAYHVGQPGPFAILVLFALNAQPTGDDYCFASYPDIISAVRENYFRLNSRWVSDFFFGLALAGRDPHLAYPWVPLLTMAGVLAGFRLLAGALVHPGRAASTVIFGLSACLFFWCNQPSPGDGTFWAPGALDYDIAFPSMSLLFYLLVRNLRSAPSIAVMIAIAFLLGPHHELFATAALFCFVILAVWMWGTGHPDRLLFTVLALVCLAGLLTVVLAPGQNNRLQRLTHSRAFLPVTVRAAWSLVLWLPRWVLDWNLWAGTALLWLSASHLRPIRTSVPLWLTAVLWLGALCSGFWVLSYAVGSAVPSRCLNFFYLWFLTGWIVLAFSIHSHFWHDQATEGPAAGIARLLLPPALAWGLFFLGNPMVGLVDLRTRLFPGWKQSRNEYVCWKGLLAVALRIYPSPHCRRFPAFTSILTLRTTPGLPPMLVVPSFTDLLR